MPVLQHPRLREINEFLDAVRADLSALVARTPRADLTRDAGEGQWNGAQIVQHLGKAEGSTAKYFEGIFAAAVGNGLADETDTASMLGSLDRFGVENGALQPLIAPDRLRPSSDADPDASWASLVAVRERTLRAWKVVDGKDLTAVVAPHPRFGPLNGYEWLLFLGKHEERHTAQLRRVLGAS